MYLVSACLAGFNTRYDGSNCLDERVRAMVAEGRAVPVCPEQLAGLPTPRKAMEFSAGDGGAVLRGQAGAVSPDGEDFSGFLVKGAMETLRIAGLYGITEAVLKDGSPSCGVVLVHSGGEKVRGRGVTAELLRENRIRVMTVDSI